MSREHGAGVTLIICFLLGVALAENWRMETNLALVSAFAGFQFPIPITRIMRHRKIELRLALWAIIYGLAAVLSTLWLWLRVPAVDRVIAVAAVILLINLIWVYLRDQKSIPNELSVFLGLCLALPFSYTASSGYMVQDLLGWWLLATLILSSTVFTVRLRLFGEVAMAKAAAYHIIALSIILFLVRAQVLTPGLAYIFLLPLVKLIAILYYLDHYRKLKLTTIGFMETGLTILFAVLVLLAV
ncbi:YwiC-like family protein [Candidatus Neomarinimicrobiota bacterium]